MLFRFGLKTYTAEEFLNHLAKVYEYTAYIDFINNTPSHIDEFFDLSKAPDQLVSITDGFVIKGLSTITHRDQAQFTDYEFEDNSEIDIGIDFPRENNIYFDKSYSLWRNNPNPQYNKMSMTFANVDLGYDDAGKLEFEAKNQNGLTHMARLLSYVHDGEFRGAAKGALIRAQQLYTQSYPPPVLPQIPSPYVLRHLTFNREMSRYRSYNNQIGRFPR